ncbi:MAG TPA: hypothetical protein VES67_01420 [Vicinamibacterales bacterium]|nr:hypothetical protein [Vicinamibacterales bacterium]
MANSARTPAVGLFGAALAMAAGMAVAPARTHSGWDERAQPRGGVQQPAPKAQPADLQAKVFADFMERVKAYVAVHQKAEATLPPLPKEATPKQIDQSQRALGTLIQSARAGAQRGDIFTPEMTALVKRLLARVFAGSDGKQLRASIMDENVKPIAIKVNQRYPDEFPLTTMPPEVLQTLPKLPEGLEYRFVSEQLILLDPHAHIIADFIIDALPGK